LLQLSEQVSRIAGTLARLSIAPADASDAREHPPELDEVGVSEETVIWLIKARRERARYLCPELFAEPAWDILLDLLRAEIARQRVSVSSLCIASGVPATTALRYINTMTEQEIIVRRRDPRDGRRVFIELTSKVSGALRRYFAEVVQAHRPG
jgi:DNA-binding MarR family transcriptional regulator